MAEAREQTALQRWGSKKSPWWLWLLVVLVGSTIVVGSVLVAQLGNSVQERRIELNERYVEQIDIESIADGGGGYKDLIVIDGASRYDCSYDEGRLSCDDDPQPTEH